jgi:hypothetical protein
MSVTTYPTQPETLIPAKYSDLIAELAAVEKLFSMRLGVTMNCGDIRLVRIDDGKYLVQELRHMRNGSAEYRHVSTHANIAEGAIAFRAAVVGPSKPDTVEFDEATGTVSIVKAS